jgi:hypothetical protein
LIIFSRQKKNKSRTNAKKTAKCETYHKKYNTGNNIRTKMEGKKRVADVEVKKEKEIRDKV